MSCWRYLQTTFLTLLNKTCCKWSLEVNIFDPKWIIGNVDSTFQVWLQSKLMISSPKWIFNPYVIWENQIYMLMFLILTQNCFKICLLQHTYCQFTNIIFRRFHANSRECQHILSKYRKHVATPFSDINIYIDVFLFSDSWVENRN